ncbi:tetratricopeptide repeat protein [Streptomyces sp. V1I1]|uniref:ATP-binding protein n=1 Tax=Streptomyces sp. V1I1 TaxID=3042272 RepID=UPI002784DDFC|nr:tetratricopeptide repeat protein [Streptomyces sp. V1I1]MDQ0941143.1 tetratricopeptide (TPR) repeat protein [Streptomyces sp. V1I1]
MVSIDIVSAVVGWLVTLCNDSGVELVRNRRDDRSLRKTIGRSVGTVIAQSDPAVRSTLEHGLVRSFSSPPKLRLDGSVSVRDALQESVADQIADFGEWVSDTTGLPFQDVVEIEPDRFTERVCEAVVSGLRQYAAASELTELVHALDTAEIIGRLEALGLRIDGLSLPTRAAATFSLPRDIPSFTGRHAELERVLEAMNVTGPAMQGVDIHAIDGMAGVGKSAMAVRAAHLLAPRFQDGQLFLHLHGHTPGQRPVDPRDALASLLLVIGVPAAQIPSDLQTRSALWRDRLRTKRILLLLDDAVSSEQVRHLLPGSQGSLVLVTSRRRLTALEGVVPISLETMPPAEAKVLFSRLAARPGLIPSDPQVAEVVRLCGYLPLAIRLTAGKLAHHPHWSVQDLVEDLAATRHRIATMRAEEDSVASAFDLSYRDLTSGQQRLFRLLGLHPGSVIDAYIAASLADIPLANAQEFLDGIFMHHLIDEPARGDYRMHDLVREKAQSLVSLDPVAETEAAVTRMLNYYQHTVRRAAQLIKGRTPESDVPASSTPPAWAPDFAGPAQAVDWLKHQRSNIHATVDYAAVHARPAHAVGISAAMNNFLRSQGHWDQAMALHESALTAATAAGDQAGEAQAWGRLGSMQRLRGEFSAAMASQERAQELHRQVDDRLGEATAVHELGVAQRLCCEYEADRASQERARELYRALGNTLGEANTLHELGTLHWLLGFLRTAHNIHAESLEIYQDLGNEYGEAFAYNQLALTNYHLGDYPTATAQIAHALDLHHALGDRHGQAYSFKELGVVEYLTGDFGSSLATLTRSVDLHRELGSRYGMGLALTDLGALHRLMGNYTAAMTTHIQAIAQHREFGFRYGEACSLKELGVVKGLLEDRAGAEADIGAALELHTSLGHRYGQTDALIAQGNLLVRRAQCEEAHDPLTSALAGARDIEAPLLEAHALEGLARCLFGTNEPEQGLSRLRDALAILQRIGSPDLQRVEEALRRHSAG